MKVFDLINYVNKLSYNGYDAVSKKYLFDYKLFFM